MAEFSGLSKVGQISVRVHDVERATAFYRDALGLPFLFAYPGMAFFDASGTWLYLTDFKEPEFDHPASVLYFDVGDIEAAHAALQARGVEFRTTPHAIHRAEGRELWLADFRDGEGNTFAIRSWKPLA
jgi:catechol 2,3-dioxygenase-like lactoylglutathione lyase family enzyme